MRHVFAVCALVVTLSWGTTASAAPVLVNGSFEIGPAMGGNNDIDVYGGSTAITGWTVFGASIDYLGPTWDVSDGIHALDLDGRDSMYAGVAQSFATTAGETYGLSFDLSGNPYAGAQIKQLRVVVGNLTQDFWFNTLGQSKTALDWTAINVFFTAPSENTTLTFVSMSPTWSSWGPMIDNVAIHSVPEPATLLLLGAGVLVTGVKRRGRKQAASVL